MDFAASGGFRTVRDLMEVESSSAATSARPVIGRLHVLLVLGRVSNLPTVWSNCLAAWLLAGGGSGRRLVLLCCGATLLYVGGMFLNDAVDVGFDRQYRRERPIPAGRISVRTVWTFAAGLLLSGWLLLLPLGLWPALAGLILLTAIVLYDIVHKHTSWAVVIMAACRFLLYVVAASAAISGINKAAVLSGLALAAYITGLSWLARGESRPGAGSQWPVLMLWVPIATALMAPGSLAKATWMVLAGVAVWVIWCIRGMFRGNARPGVAGLLAGIALVDWLAVAIYTGQSGLVFGTLFLAALITQRVAPAT